MSRATSFGSDPERYDRARPSYPEELVERLLAGGVQRVLDVGCGTGKAARLFAARGREVLGVEADERMASVARSHGIAVEVARFEEWEPHGRVFDLVVSGQAWHWVDAESALPRIAQALRPDGRFAAFWNLGRPEIAEELADPYRRLAPELEHENSALFGAGGEALTERHVAPLAAEPRLRDAEIWSYSWRRRYTRDEWLELLRTQSDHILLPDDRRGALLGELAAIIDAHGGAVDVPYVTAVVTALRR